MSKFRLEVPSKKKSLEKSPNCSTAAETLILVTRQFEKPELEIQTQGKVLKASRKKNLESVRKSLKRTQCTDFFKAAEEKSQKFQTLRIENQVLSGQIAELVDVKNKYKKAKAIICEKDQVIDHLRSSIETLKKKPLLKPLKSFKNPSLKIHSRLSFDSNSDLLQRPLTSLHNMRVNSLPRSMRNLLKRTESVLKAWKKNPKKSKKNLKKKNLK